MEQQVRSKIDVGRSVDKLQNARAFLPTTDQILLRTRYSRVKSVALGSVSAKANRSGLGLIDSVMGCLLVISVLAGNEEMQEYRQLLYLTER